MPDRVRAHTRNGKPVRAHSRQSRPRKGLVSPRHAWQLAKRARRASKKKKTVLACVLGALAVGELASWLVLDTAGMVLSLAGFVLVMAGGFTVLATGREAHPADVRAFGRGHTSSASAAEGYARRERDKAATKKAGNLAEQSRRHRQKKATT